MISRSCRNMRQNKEFYESIGLTEMERELLANYNFGLDEEIDEDLVLKVADYAASIRQVERPFLQNLLDSLKSDYRRMCYEPTHNESDYPWNYMVILAYVAVLVLSLMDGEKKMPALGSALQPSGSDFSFCCADDPLALADHA
ncbi:MAG: hypothetical protein V8S42_02295 [Lachnospiraceae bacterium]